MYGQRTGIRKTKKIWQKCFEKRLAIGFPGKIWGGGGIPRTFKITQLQLLTEH